MNNSLKQSRKDLSPNLYPFYLSVSRGTASQMDMKLKKSNERDFEKKKDI